MKPCHLKPFILLSLISLMVFGCNNPDSANSKKIEKNVPRLVGTWQQATIGEEIVTGIVVKIIFSEHTLTMDAPGCMIIGDYTTDNNTLTYMVTAVQGERCSKQQMIGQSDIINYAVTDAQLTMTPLSAGKESQVVYTRIDDNESHH